LEFQLVIEQNIIKQKFCELPSLMYFPKSVFGNMDSAHFSQESLKAMLDSEGQNFTWELEKRMLLYIQWKILRFPINIVYKAYLKQNIT